MHEQTRNAPISPLIRGSGLAAWRQVADVLQADIAEGRLGPGDLIGTEAILSARFGVNRHTVRRGLSHLAAQGLVRAVQGRGTFVAGTAGIAAGLGRGHGKALLAEPLPKPGREARGDLVYAGHAMADAEIAGALALAPGSPVLEMQTRAMSGDHVHAISRTFVPLPRFLGLDEIFAARGTLARAYRKLGMVDCRRLSIGVQARPADAGEVAALALASGAMALVLTAINADENGTPIQHSRVVYPADRVELFVKR